jgi:hypothetical protein
MPSTQRRSRPVKGSVEWLVLGVLVDELGTVGDVVLVLEGDDEVVLGFEVSLEGPVPLAGPVVLVGAGLGGVL